MINTGGTVGLAEGIIDYILAHSTDLLICQM